MNRTKAREKLFLMLFSVSFHDENSSPDESVFSVIDEFDDDNYVNEAFSYITSNLHSIDEEIQKYLIRRKVSRLSKVAVNCLRIAFYEIEHLDDVPGPVAANEAVSIVKKYDTEETARYVNGVLGSFLKSAKTE